MPLDDLMRQIKAKVLPIQPKIEEKSYSLHLPFFSFQNDRICALSWKKRKGDFKEANKNMEISREVENDNLDL